ncbi:uncharacterized protein [Oscarella lobularis]|uniref:uncharacterized protein isoform X2 n=1 Tax=Oscarella lobularis TaxID=121494 RepID=UPI00331378B1
MAKAESPEPRHSHESALIEDELHIFGGRKGDYPSHYFPRNEIWTCNVREEKKWMRRFAEGRNVPPPCWGAQCVVINGIIYSYGGEKEDGGILGEVFGLDPKKRIWIQVATPINGKKPYQRCYCCLWAIGGRMIMFGGFSEYIPPNRLQSGAQFNGKVNNESYEFVFEEGREKDVELSGKRPQPRAYAAMETIDQHRGLLHGGWNHKSLDDTFVIDLREKKWICIDIFPKPSARFYHRMCRLVKRGFERKSCFLMIGGYKKESSDSGYIIDFDNQKSHKIDLTPDVAPVSYHTLHCVANQDGSAHIIISGGFDRKIEYRQIMKIFTLDPSNESYTKIESLLLAGCTLIPSSVNQKSIRDVEQQMERMRQQYETLRAERSSLAAQCHDLQEQVERQNAHFQAESRRLVAEKLEKESQCQALQAQCETLELEKTHHHAERQTFESQINEIRTQFHAERQALESRCQVIESQRQTLQESFEESRRSLDQFIEVLSISPQQIQLTQDKLGTGAYAGK